MSEVFCTNQMTKNCIKLLLHTIYSHEFTFDCYLYRIPLVIDKYVYWLHLIILF